MTINLTKEQEIAYNRFIKARNKLRRGNWIPQTDYFCVDVAGINHPLFVANEEYLEYKEAFLNWLKVEPAFREKERLRSSRGDYGSQDSWEEKSSKVKEL